MHGNIEALTPGHITVPRWPHDLQCGPTHIPLFFHLYIAQMRADRQLYLPDRLDDDEKHNKSMSGGQGAA